MDQGKSVAPSYLLLWKSERLQQCEPQTIDFAGVEYFVIALDALFSIALPGTLPSNSFSFQSSEDHQPKRKILFDIRRLISSYGRFFSFKFN